MTAVDEVAVDKPSFVGRELVTCWSRFSDLFECFHYYFNAMADDVEELYSWNEIEDEEDPGHGFSIAVMKLHGSSEPVLVASDWIDMEPDEDVPEQWRCYYFYRIHHGSRDNLLKKACDVQGLRAELSNTNNSEIYYKALDKMCCF